MSIGNKYFFKKNLFGGDGSGNKTTTKTSLGDDDNLVKLKTDRAPLGNSPQRTTIIIAPFLNFTCYNNR